MTTDRSAIESDERIVTASTRGFNPLEQVPKLLYKLYPDLRNWNLGFFIEEHCPARLVDGWEFLEPSDFPGVDVFNKSIPARYGIVLTADGRLKLKENYIMKMRKDYRERYEAEVRRQSEEYYESVTQRPRKVEGGEDTYSEFSEKRVSPSQLPGQEPKRRGRPPKEK